MAKAGAIAAGFSMDFSTTQDFPAGLDRLWAVFGRPEYPLRKYESLGATAIRMHVFHVTAQLIEVDLERDVSVDPVRLPAWARTFIGSGQTLRHRTQWRRIGPTQAAAELDISPNGLPVSAHGVGVIGETAPGTTRMVLSWRVRTRLPFMRSSVERLFAREVRMALDADHAFTLRYLRRAQPDRRQGA